MELFWIIIGSLFILAGLAGSLLPVVPGPPLSYVGLLFLQLTPEPPFKLGFLLFWAVITGVVVVADQLIPVYGTKKFGGSRLGILGCIIGLVAGILFFPPLGIIIGPVLGAFVGETVAGKRSGQAFRAAFGSFAGYLLSTLLRVSLCSVLAYYFFVNL